ncbi:putative dehydrogenase [Pedobacter sp. UYEF25]
MLLKKLTLLILLSCFAFGLKAQKKLNVVVDGLSHALVYDVINDYINGDINIIAIVEPDLNVVAKFKRKLSFPQNIYYGDLAAALKDHKPDIVLAYNATSEHIDVIETAAPLGIPVMVEKPLCLNNKEAERIAFLSKKYNVKVLTNYEITWYPSNQEIFKKVKEENKIGNITKMISADGNKGPMESGLSREFLSWLTDPAKNGAGALYDFGCYGANLMMCMMDGKAPISVTAVLNHLKPSVYPNVDDDASITLEYPKITGVIRASWCFPTAANVFAVVGDKGEIQATDRATVNIKEEGIEGTRIYSAKPLDSTKSNYINYLNAVLKDNVVQKNDLSSLENNMIVMKILVAAKESAKTGNKVYLK